MIIFPFLIFLILFTLKLAAIGQVASWSWWYVTMPLWSFPAVAGALFGLTLVCGFLLEAFRRAKGFVEDERRKKEAMRETEDFLENK